MSSFVDSLAEELLRILIPRITEAVVQEITQRLKDDEVFQYSEEKAAVKLNITPQQLARIRKDKEIEFSYTMMPTMGKDGKLHNGRVAYTPQHIADFLKRREQKQFFGNLRAA